jgi:hypothetical protein
VDVRTGEGRTADPCAEGGSQRQRVADVRAALPVVEPPDVAAAGDAAEPPDADPARADFGRRLHQARWPTPPAPEADADWRLALGILGDSRQGRHQAPCPSRSQPPGPRPVMDSAPVARYAAFYEFLISAVEKAIFRQSRDRRIRPRAVYAGWARRNRPKCGTVNAIRPRSEL